MANFVSIGKYYINTDRVVTITMPDMTGSIWIEMDGGQVLQTIEAEARYLPDILGVGWKTAPLHGSQS